MEYLGHFIVYVLAMLSVIFLALFVYKKFSMNNFQSRKSGRLNIEESLNLSPRKTLYIVQADGEKFLIAADMERTTLISKLENSDIEKPVADFIRNEDILLAEEPQPVMKNLVKKLGGRV